MLLITEYHITWSCFNGKCIPMIYWTINQHWSGNSQNVITYTNDGSFHCCISTPFGLNGLKCNFADIFKWIFITEKKNFECNFTEVHSWWSSWHYLVYLWFRQWLGSRLATSHYLNHWWPHVSHYMVSPDLNELTHRGLVRSNGNTDLGQHWLK